MTGRNYSTHTRHTLFSSRPTAGGLAGFVTLCVLTGAAIGCAAALLKCLTGGISRVAVSGLAADAMPWRFLLLPIAGIILAGSLQRFLIHRNLDHGTDRINDALVARNYLMPWSVAWGSIAGASVTLGLGGSAGAEGPIAYAGAAIGSRVAGWFRMTPSQMGAMVAIGAGAGIAGIFRAPVGGMMFVVEVLSFGLSTVSVLGLASACISAGVAAYMLGGFEPDLLLHHIPSFDPLLMAWSVPLGLLCGLYSVYYSAVMNRMTDGYERMSNQWLRWIVAGASIALMVFSFPALYGEGYRSIARILDGKGAEALAFGSWLADVPGLTAAGLAILLSGGVALFKAPAAASTNSGGGVAGDFAPTIFAGAAVGFFAATMATTVLGLSVAPAALVFMAMGGVMAGAVRAPLMAMFLVAEMTGAFSLFLPLALTAVISFLVVRAFGRRQNKRATR